MGLSHSHGIVEGVVRYVVDSEGNWWYTKKPRVFHTGIYANYVLEHPEKFSEELSHLAEQLLETGQEEDGRFEDDVQMAGNLFSVEHSAPWKYSTENTLIIKVADRSPKSVLMEAVKKIQRLYRTDKLDLSQFTMIYLVSNRHIAVKPASMIDLVAGFDGGGDVIYKEFEEEKGGPGSGFHGHRGRPGKVGGSLPEGTTAMPEISIDETDRVGPFSRHAYETLSREFGITQAQHNPLLALETYSRLAHKVKSDSENGNLHVTYYVKDEHGEYVMNHWEYVKEEFDLNQEQMDYLLNEAKALKDERVRTMMEQMGMPERFEDFFAQFPGNLETVNYYGNDPSRWDTFNSMERKAHEIFYEYTDPTAYTSNEVEYSIFDVYDQQVNERYGEDSEQAKNLRSWMNGMGYALHEEAQFEVRHQIALGNISPDYAGDRLGYHNLTQGGEWTELPTDLWHVTTNRAAVENDQLRSRRELAGQGQGYGLAGGESDTISFTGDEKVAKGIERAIQEGHLVAQGRISTRNLFEMAQVGRGTSKPYIKEMLENVYGRELKDIPEDYDFFGEEAHRRFSDLWDQIDWEDGKREPKISEWRIHDDQTPQDWLNEQRWRHYSLHFLSARQHAGGPMDPVFFGTNWRGLAKMDPGNISTLHLKARSGSRGYQMSGLGEWRTVGGDTVELWDTIEHYMPEDILEEDGIG